MAMKFYDPGELNLLNGSSCSGIQCLWYCFPWDVMPANVIVLTGLTSLGCRKDPLLTLCQTLAGMTRVCPAFACSWLLQLSVSVCVLFQHLIFLSFCDGFRFFILTPHLALCCPCYCRHYLLRQKNLLKIERPVFFSPFMAVLPSLFNLCLWAEYY